jgi:hypothetical protein
MNSIKSANSTVLFAFGAGTGLPIRRGGGGAGGGFTTQKFEAFCWEISALSAKFFNDWEVGAYTPFFWKI